MDSPTRHPVVAGRFYPRDPEDLRDAVRSFLPANLQPAAAIGCMVPHAGYMYSGHVAGAVFAALNPAKRAIILGPNHTGRGRALSIMSKGRWETPLGEARIDSALAETLRQSFSGLDEDAEAHHAEHAIEVELPFLQVLRSDFEFVPIAMGTTRFELMEMLGNAITQALAQQQEKPLLIASSDMNHYESDPITRIKDAKAIDRILALDPHGLFDVVMKEEISMCGIGPAVTMLIAAKQLGAKQAELIKYATSGDVSADRETVVGYAGVIVR